MMTSARRLGRPWPRGRATRRNARVGTGRRGHRGAAGRPRDRPAERHRDRHGRHELRREPRSRRAASAAADHRAGLPARRRAVGGGRADRRRRRLHRPRRGWRPARRPPQRGRRARAGVLRARRHGAHGDRRRRRARRASTRMPSWRSHPPVARGCRRAIDGLAHRLDVRPVVAAAGIVRVAEAQMADLVRKSSAGTGPRSARHDPARIRRGRTAPCRWLRAWNRRARGHRAGRRVGLLGRRAVPGGMAPHVSPLYIAPGAARPRRGRGRDPGHGSRCEGRPGGLWARGAADHPAGRGPALPAPDPPRVRAPRWGHRRGLAGRDRRAIRGTLRGTPRAWHGLPAGRDRGDVAAGHRLHTDGGAPWRRRADRDGGDRAPDRDRSRGSPRRPFRGPGSRTCRSTPVRTWTRAWVRGPALVAWPTTTLVLHPGHRADVMAGGHVRVRFDGERP